MPEMLARKTPPPGGDLAICAGSSAPACRFVNSPVKLQPTPVRLKKRPRPFYPTAQELDFIDAAERRWVAPETTLTDGASIPEIFISMIGDPTSREFVNAAVIHDAYCGVGNEKGPRFHSADWRSVHRMFYDALRVGGTPEVKAKVMYAAVYIGGPRWGVVRDSGPGSAANAAAGVGAVSARARRGVSPAKMRAILRQTMRQIETANPPLPEIESFADGLLAAALSQSRNQGEGGREASEHGSGGNGHPETGSDPAAGSNPAAGGDPAIPATPATDSVV